MPSEAYAAAGLRQPDCADGNGGEGTATPEEDAELWGSVRRGGLVRSRVPGDAAAKQGLFLMTCCVDFGYFVFSLSSWCSGGLCPSIKDLTSRH